jgi:hypothetical protein
LELPTEKCFGTIIVGIIIIIILIIIIIIIKTDCTHICENVYEEDVTVLWNQAVHTDREVTANRTDTVIKNKQKTCTLIDVAIPADRNVVQKEADKKLKYNSLGIEKQRMWN